MRPQETHLSAKKVVRVRRRWPGQVFLASFSSHAWGMITNDYKSVPFQLINVADDWFRRYLIIECEILSIRLNLVHVCGTNDDNSTFLRQLFLLLAASPGHFIIGVDFSYALQPELDRSKMIDTSHPQTRKELLQCMKDNLVDVWRWVAHPANIFLLLQ